MADAKQGKGSEDIYNGSTQSRVVLAKPRLGGFGSSTFASSSNKTSNPFGSVLRPAQLKPNINPFLKPGSIDDDTKEKSEDRLKEKEKNETEENQDVPKFVPLGANDTRTGNQVPAPAQPTSSTSSASFIFGQNLSARVVMGNVNNGDANNGDSPSVDHSSSNGTSAELLFTSAAASVKENNQEESSTEGHSRGSGLAAAAAEYERSHARPPPPAEHHSITGEEGEINVLQVTCRLFAWESGSWRERGRGMLRLNDAAQGGGARLVARVAGSLRVVLNTKLWPDMVAERAGTKSLRITAADAQQQVKLFLIMGAPQDITQLHRALTTRIAVSKRLAPTHTCSNNATSQQAAERLEAEADFPDSTDTDKTDDERLQPDSTHKEEYESNVDGMKEDVKSLKRKEQPDDGTSPKRQCPDTKE